MKLTEYIPKLGRPCDDRLTADRLEILEYIRVHPGCETFDIELECHQSRAAVDMLLRKLRQSGQVQNGWWAL